MLKGVACVTVPWHFAECHFVENCSVWLKIKMGIPPSSNFLDVGMRYFKTCRLAYGLGLYTPPQVQPRPKAVSQEFGSPSVFAPNIRTLMDSG